jgi:hypothetical protein
MKHAKSIASTLQKVDDEHDNVDTLFFVMTRNIVMRQ